ncbi:MAG: hypothetical protein A2Z86_05540 [Candidatus Glassbacteria bacterium GWA2_58_10]|uniref:Uncharacterized protein n=1 Tax=Candidatus Glassbacteria bacterium GWA2_58_10 TaxID=1817865 RepID=A0A1F5YE12_9BACT|nr:MAG: hypothetical protein A2Z86_05540 [Candidatus Glassbacteria bacterium GWA2_58_10]
MKKRGQADRGLRQSALESLYRAYLQEGLYRGVVSKKSLSAELGAEGAVLERNLEYLLDRGLIRMHKIEDLISITTEGVDWLETDTEAVPAGIISSLERIESLLKALLKESRDAKKP